MSTLLRHRSTEATGEILSVISSSALEAGIRRTAREGTLRVDYKLN
jgi:hypothetical protein